MPALHPPATILVTGANGYVGCSVVRALLDRGYSVRGAVRTEEKARILTELVRKKHPRRRYLRLYSRSKHICSMNSIYLLVLGQQLVRRDTHVLNVRRVP